MSHQESTQRETNLQESRHGPVVPTLVYTGEHYVEDIAAGWLIAVGAIGASRSSLIPRGRPRQRRNRRPAADHAE